MTTVCEPAPTVGGFGLQFELPVLAGSLQRSCQVEARGVGQDVAGRLKSAALTV